jgi:hypothetical protein
MKCSPSKRSTVSFHVENNDISPWQVTTELCDVFRGTSSTGQLGDGTHTVTRTTPGPINPVGNKRANN